MNSSLNLGHLFKRSTALILAYICLISLVLGFYFAFSVNNQQKTAQASTPVLSLAPGQTARITIYYDNANGATDYLGQARIRVLIDERLEYVPGYLKDTYGSEIKCVNDGVSAGIRTVQNIANQQATVIDYTPRSSEIAAPAEACTTGGGVLGNSTQVFIPRSSGSFNPNSETTWRGRLQFRVKLKETVTKSPYNLTFGNIIEPNLDKNSIALQSEFSLNNVVYGASQYSIRVSGVQISHNNVVSGNCLNQPILIGEKAVCGFSLTGGNDTTDIYLLPPDFKAQIEGSTESANTDQCEISSRDNLVVCNLPTVGASPGNSLPIKLTLSGITQNRANINLVSDFDPKGDFDNDGITNEIECGSPNGINCLDTDQDGVADYKDSDSDGDGIPDAVEAVCSLEVGSGFPCDSDGDGIPDYKDFDSDNDKRQDKEERGAFNCAMEKFPPTCEGVLRDSDGDGIPNFRDKDDGEEQSIRFLIPEQSIKFSHQNSPRPIWKQADLVVSASIPKTVSECEIRFRKYSSSDWWITVESEIKDKTCTGTLKSTRQYTQKWDTLMILTDSEGFKWGAYPSHTLENGPMGITEIKGTGQDGPQV